MTHPSIDHLHFSGVLSLSTATDPRRKPPLVSPKHWPGMVPRLVRDSCILSFNLGNAIHEKVAQGEQIGLACLVALSPLPFCLSGHRNKERKVRRMRRRGVTMWCCLGPGGTLMPGQLAQTDSLSCSSYTNTGSLVKDDSFHIAGSNFPRVGKFVWFLQGFHFLKVFGIFLEGRFMKIQCEMENKNMSFIFPPLSLCLFSSI